VPPHVGISARRESSWATHASNAETSVSGFPLAFAVEGHHNPWDGDAAPAMDDLSTTNAKDGTSTPTSTECGAHGIGGSSCGSSSYIDDLVRRDRDANTSWNGTAGDGTLEERLFYCQNWRHDVVALVTSGGQLKERARYFSYGVPFGITLGDCDGDGDTDTADQTLVLGAWGTNVPKCDLNLDGTVDGSDNTMLLAEVGATAGFGNLGRNRNRFGYAGYAADMAVNVDWHVRHRVLLSELGRWAKRDPAEYTDGSSLYSYIVSMLLANTDPLGLEAAPPDPCKRCNQRIALDFSDNVVKNLKHLIASSCPSCSPPSISCKNPAEDSNCTTASGVPLKGYVTPPVAGGCPAVTLCCGRESDETLQHELTHFLDLCSTTNHPQGLSECKLCAWLEARATAMERNDCKLSLPDLREGCRSCKATGKCASEEICIAQWELKDLNRSLDEYPMPCYRKPKPYAPPGTGDYPWDPNQWHCGVR
jgi:RHS repeat-associated protein